MKRFWLVKTEPTTYSIHDLKNDTVTLWDGVKNATAQIHVKNMKKGDEVFIYHTGSEKKIVGMAKVSSSPRAEQTDKAKSLYCVELQFVSIFNNPISLSLIKSIPALSSFPLVRNSRLSVMPVENTYYEYINTFCKTAIR